jgi:uncharacterized delta-60 repeat protein
MRRTSGHTRFMKVGHNTGQQRQKSNPKSESDGKRRTVPLGYQRQAETSPIADKELDSAEKNVQVVNIKTSLPNYSPGSFALVLFCGVALLAGGLTAGYGQSALDGFDPNADGSISVVVLQTDGKILIGGDFTTLAPNGGAPITRNRIARLNLDGTVDMAFDPNANGSVRAIAVQPDGRILVGGFFNGANSIGGATRNYIARLDPTTGVADSFNPDANDGVYSIVVQADGGILAGGGFRGTNSIGGATRNRIARLDPTTGLADSFDPNANNQVYAIAVQADGKVLAGGAFNGTNSIGGATRNYMARLDPTTGLADSFDPNAVFGSVLSIAVQPDGKILAGGDFLSIGGQGRNHIARLDAATGLADEFNPNANNSVYSIAVQADGRILAGGSFTTISGNSRPRIARLDAITGFADSFNPGVPGGPVFSIAVQPDRKIVVGGFFNGANSIGGAARNRIARLETDGRVEQTVDLNTVGSLVLATAIQPDGKILIGGIFSAVLGVTRNNIARLNTDGTLDSGFNPNANSLVESIAVQADGKVLLGGGFSMLSPNGGAPVMRNRIARLNADGTLDAAFNPNANTFVHSIAVQADGKILVGGAFNGTNSIGGQTRNYMARLDSTTGLADSFDPNANGRVRAIAIQTDGQILVGGEFFGANSIGGQTRNRLARLDPATGLADSFDPNASNAVALIVVQPDGKVLAGGFFNGTNSIGGQNRNHIARLDPTTGLADAFDPNANAVLSSVALQADGKILAGGNFSTIGGQARNRIARLDPVTGLADSFNPDANNGVASVVVQADGKVLAGGSFSTIGGQTRNRFARLVNDTVALQSLAVSQTTVTWARAGSSPQFARVAFESSTNNVNFNPFGHGTAAGPDWTLSGLDLPSGQNIYIRARGFCSAAYQNNSQGIIESVWKVVLARPLLNIQRSANTDVVLSWPTNFTGFTLEANTNLNTTVWSGVSPAPAVSGTNNVVTNAAGGSARFYRLRK